MGELNHVLLLVLLKNLELDIQSVISDSVQVLQTEREKRQTKSHVTFTH